MSAQDNLSSQQFPPVQTRRLRGAPPMPSDEIIAGEFATANANLAVSFEANRCRECGEQKVTCGDHDHEVCGRHHGHQA